MAVPARSGPGARRVVRPRALLEACHPEPTLAVTTIAVALAWSSGRSAAGTAAAGAAVLAGQLCVGWHNDWVDAERDTRARRARKPIARGDIARRSVGRAALAAGLATVPLSALSGYRAGLAHIGAVGLALAYNVKLKATILSWVPYLVAFPLLVAFVSWGRHPAAWPPWWALVGAALLGTGAHLANAAPDIAQDMVDGIGGLPQSLGERRSVELAVGLMAGSTLLVSLAVPYPAVAGGAAGGLLVITALVVARRQRPGPRRRAVGPGLQRRPRAGAMWGPGAWFRLSMVVALANVALLVARGSSL